jgi:starvation-inducible DNA-binding protein
MQTQDKVLPVDIGIEDENRKQIAQGLSRLLADTYSLYLKTHYFHWNVTGSLFHSLHQMFEEQYTELAMAVDTIAERIRSLGYFAPGSYSEFAELSSIKETREVPSAEDMVRLLTQGNEAVVRTAREALPAAERGDDESTKDLLAERLRVHEKTAWMLRSILNKV